jgi:hypothetical protein
MASVLIDDIVEQVSLSLDTLETVLAHSSTAQTTDDGVYALGETTDLFTVWQRNTSVAQEECKSYENCTRNNPELRLTLAELLVDIKDDLTEGKCNADSAIQSTDPDTVHPAQYSPGPRSLGDAKVLAVPYDLDTTSTLSLGTILADVNSALSCLMRLSKPLLDNHRRHRTIDRYCAEGGTHHAQQLQRLLPRVEWTTLKQLSRSTCARRNKVLMANSRRRVSSAAFDDAAFLRAVLLELVSVTGGLASHQHQTSVGHEIAPENETDRIHWNDFSDAETFGSRKGKHRQASPVEQKNSVARTHFDIFKQSAVIEALVQRHRDQVHSSGTQKVSKRLIHSYSSGDLAKNPGLPSAASSSATGDICCLLNVYDPH